MAEKIHTKTLQLTDIRVKADREFPGGTVQGLASTFDNVDLQGERVLRGAFADDVRNFDEKRGLPLLDSHRIFDGIDAIIGKVISIAETSRGLKFRAFFSQTEEAQKIRKKLTEGIFNGVSIGFNVIDKKIGRDGIVDLVKLKLREISLTFLPANELAQVTSVKSHTNGTASTEKPAPEMHSADRARAYERRMRKLTAQAKARRAAEEQRSFELWEKSGRP